MRLLLCAAISFAALPAAAQPSECDSPDADWLFCEDFEQGGLGWEAWFAQSPFVECLGCSGGSDNPDRIMLDGDPARAMEGDWSLYMPAEAAADYRGASLGFRSCEGTKQVGCTPLTGYDQLYYRAWLFLAADHQYVHHFMSIAGTRPNNYWDSDGNAGCRPNGYRAAGTTVDFNPSHELFFYTYTPDMNCDDIYAGGGYCGDMQPGICDGCADKEMPCTGEPECCWGNHYSTDPRPVLPVGRWVCLEMMMRLNTPTQSDGEMSFWLDDQLGHAQAGMYWRDAPELQLNKIWLQHYIASGDASQSNRIWWDNVIASTSRIGCGEGPPPEDGAPLPDGAGPPDGGPLPDGGGSPGGDERSGGDSATITGDGATGPGQDPVDLDPPLFAGCSCAQGEPGGLGIVALGVLAALGWVWRRRRRYAPAG